MSILLTLANRRFLPIDGGPPINGVALAQQLVGPGEIVPYDRVARIGIGDTLPLRFKLYTRLADAHEPIAGIPS